MALATLLGMNVLHGLENRAPVVFWVVLLLGMALGLRMRVSVTRSPSARGKEPGQKG
ncbi:MAG: hypothetical protein ACKO3N_09830 [Verrucomicrobiota bacterium]